MEDEDYEDDYEDDMYGGVKLLCERADLLDKSTLALKLMCGAIVSLN